MTQSNQFHIGQTITITPLSVLGCTSSYHCRIVGISDYTLSFSVPYDQGKIILWPMGTKVQVVMAYPQGDFEYKTEIIGKSFEGIKSYTIMKAHSISRVNEGTRKTAMSRVLAVTSGKGGVGKTTFVINLAIAFANLGKRVYVIDLDLGTANVDVLLGIRPKYNIGHLILGEKSLTEIAVLAPGNIFLIPGSSGVQELTMIKDYQFTQIISTFNQLEGLADIILLDAGACISKDVSNFLLASDEVIVVTTPEPHAMLDAYAIMKVMHTNDCQAKQMLVVNKAENEAEGKLTSDRLLAVVRYYLHREVQALGHILEDRLVSRSLKKQVPLMLSNPTSQPAENIKKIAAGLLNIPQDKQGSSGITGFISKLYWSFKQKKV